MLDGERHMPVGVPLAARGSRARPGSEQPMRLMRRRVRSGGCWRHRRAAAVHNSCQEGVEGSQSEQREQELGAAATVHGQRP